MYTKFPATWIFDAVVNITDVHECFLSSLYRNANVLAGQNPNFEHSWYFVYLLENLRVS